MRLYLMKSTTLAFALVALSAMTLFAQTDESKLQGALEALIDNQHGVSVESFAEQRGIHLYNQSVNVMIVVGASLSATLSDLYNLNVSVNGIYKDWIDANVPLAQLRAVSLLSSIDYVRLPYAARPTAVISQGVNLIGATEYQDVGYTGKGVKIAIIDLGFEGMADAIASGDLPSNAQSFDFTNAGMGGISHGTAVSEIVYDVAPDAQLLLMKVSNEVNLGHAVEEALRQGADIINHSVVWFNTEFGDGRGGVSEVASQAVDRGVVWVNAAGNTALQHWQGVHRDSDDDRWVEFDTRGSETIELDADQGSVIEIFMNWNAWPQTDVNYDLFLTYDANDNGRADPGEVFVSSTDPQRGLDQPVEHVRLFAPFTGTYLISVQYQSAVLPPDFEIFTTGHTLRTPVREGSVLAPATAKNVLAVGAVAESSWGAGTIQPFSAQGPTSDGRLKPDLVAPDDVNNFTAFRFSFEFGGTGRFIGTSASAPHIAGAAALLFEETPGMTSGQAFLALTRNARAIPSGPPNNMSGYGQVQLQLTPIEGLDLTFSTLELSKSVVEIDELFTVNIELHNPHRRVVAQTISLMIDGVVVAVQEVALGPGEIRSVEFSWRLESGGDYQIAAGSLSPTMLRVVSPLAIGFVALYANTRTQLLLNVQGQGIARLEVNVFDLAGRRVAHHQSDSSPMTIPFVDNLGRPLANGVYLYSLVIEGASQTQRFPLRKLLVLF